MKVWRPVMVVLAGTLLALGAGAPPALAASWVLSASEKRQNLTRQEE